MRSNQTSHVLEGRHYMTNEPIRVHTSGAVIERIEALPVDGSAERRSLEQLPWIGPGLVDLQVNGHAGFDMNTHPVSAEQVVGLTHALWKEGVTSYYPTLITNEPEQIEEALRVITDVCRKEKEVADAIAGIHLEGPFISMEEGPRGAHPQQYVIPPDWSLLQRWQEAAYGRIKLLTMSPEWPDSAAFISRCADSGMIVSIGHTAATPEQIAEAAAAGASMSTHLGNGAHLVLPRHPNYLWEQLAQDSLWGCVIGDGFHVPSAFLKVMRRAKRDKWILISDAVLYSGMAPGSYVNPVMGAVELTPEGRLHLQRDARLLAGSAQMLTHGIAYMANQGICTLPEAWDSASIAPSTAMGLPAQAGLEPGAPADLVLYSRTDDNQLHIQLTCLQGKTVYARQSS